ncbi:MAG: hypothetical protein QOE89_2677 [Pseudonocardiales bacterium]|nr:hypothetical protein [Pseudonocardiales bacterium]
MDTVDSLYDHVRQQITALLPAYGLSPATSIVVGAYELLCKESLALPRVSALPGRSRLNADGSPFQFALTLPHRVPALQFLTETGPPDATTAAGLAGAHDKVRRLLTLFGASDQVAQTTAWLEDVAPRRDVDLLGAEGGAIWLGAAFASENSPKLKIYLNAKWGQVAARWSRIASFAAHLDAAQGWKLIQKQAFGELEPLGIALVLGAGSAPTGRIYLSGYGKPTGYYEELAGRCGWPTFGVQLRRYFRSMLREDCRYPTRSAVCSFGIRGGVVVDMKVELCAHCAFDSDVDVRDRSVSWLREAGTERSPYLEMLELLTGEAADSRAAGVHAYLGLGSQHDQPITTFYFNPAAAGGLGV